MKRDFSDVLTGLAGQRLVDEKGDDLTLGSVSVTALLAQYQDEQALSGDEKFRRYQLAERIAKLDVQEVSAEEVALLKRLIGKGYGPMLVGPAYVALERDPTAEISAG